MNYNSLISKEILTDLETTYKMLRKITNKNIIFIPPSGISNTLNKALNNLSYDYHITYLESSADISSSLINALEKLQFL